MCNFFSFISDGKGKTYYFNWQDRQELLKSNPKELNPDSHASIAEFYNLIEDKTNKYEYNPLLKKFKIDQINNKDDSHVCERWVANLDFKKIIEPLIIKPITRPFEIKPQKISEVEIALLKEWASVGDSVGDSVWDSVGASVGASVRDSVWASVRASVGDSVRDSVWASVRDSVWDSVRDSVWAYISTFFDIKYKHDFSSAIKLWKKGIVPSFDGKTWRLHSGKKAEVVYDWKIGG